MLKFKSRSNTEYLYNYTNNKIYKCNQINKKLYTNAPTNEINFYSCYPSDLKINHTKCLVINITNKCNMRCQYCAYSGKYKFERVYNNKSIKFEIAKKAIDIFLNRCDNNSIVNFYGGEPTIEFKLIRDIVNYICYKNNQVNFSINTNFYNINNEMIEFFIEKKFKLFISIDGPKNLHDKNRIDINHNGTYDKIYNNLHILYNKNKKYFTSNVFYLCVLSYPYSLYSIYNLFNYDIIFKQPWSISSTMPFNTNIKTIVNLFESNNYLNDIMNIANDYIDSVINNKTTHFGTWIFGRILKKNLL